MTIFFLFLFEGLVQVHTIQLMLVDSCRNDHHVKSFYTVSKTSNEPISSSAGSIVGSPLFWRVVKALHFFFFFQNGQGAKSTRG